MLSFWKTLVYLLGFFEHFRILTFFALLHPPGNSNAHDVEWSIQLPAGTSLASSPNLCVVEGGSSSPIPEASLSPTPGTVTGSLGSAVLAPNGRVIATFNLEVTNGEINALASLVAEMTNFASTSSGTNLTPSPTPGMERICKFAKLKPHFKHFLCNRWQVQRTFRR